MRINNKQELQKFLEERIPRSIIGSYAIVTYNDITESIYIANYGRLRDDCTEDYYLESPNQLYTYEIRDEEDLEYWKDAADVVRDNKAYSIESWQTGPFLPDVIDDIKLITPEECVDFLLAS